MASISSAGVGSGLDVNGIIDKLMSVERQPLALLQARETGIQTKLSALGSLKSSVLSFQDAVKALDNISKFTAMKASVADTTVASVSASSSAVSGTYNLEVISLAASHGLRSDAFTDANTVVGSGTMTFSFGTYSSGANTFTANADKAIKTITISSSQTTVGSIRDAINSANIGVRANLINDGSGVRLAISSVDGGTANSLRITTHDDDGTDTNTSGLSQLAFDPVAAVGSGKNLTQATAAASASVKIDGVSITSNSNTLTNSVDGLTINLLKTTATGVTTAITASQDTSSAQSTVDSFVKAYNVLVTQISTLTSYDAKTKKAGLLNGDGTTRSILAGIRGTLNQRLSGLSGSYTNLSSVGITFQKDGTLAFNTAKFQTALAAGATPVGALFTRVGQTTDTRVTFSSSTNDTPAGTYAITTTVAATRGSLVASADAGLTITAGNNDTFTVVIDGTSATVTLSAGTYATTAALAAEVQARLNGNTTLSAAGKTVTTSASSNRITIYSQTYGSTSTAASASGNGATNLLGASPTATSGVNVAGSIGSTSATGLGQFLTSSNGLSVKITATTTGSFGDINFSRGYGSLMTTTVDNYTKTKGLFGAKEEGLNASIKTIDQRQEEMERRLVNLEKRYRAQFTALDSSVSRMSQTSNFLSQQLTALQNLSSARLK